MQKYTKNVNHLFDGLCRVLIDNTEGNGALAEPNVRCLLILTADESAQPIAALTLPTIRSVNDHTPAMETSLFFSDHSSTALRVVWVYEMRSIGNTHYLNRKRCFHQDCSKIDRSLTSRNALLPDR